MFVLLITLSLAASTILAIDNCRMKEVGRYCLYSELVRVHGSQREEEGQIIPYGL